jgi:hypothetical protein
MRRTTFLTRTILDRNLNSASVLQSPAIEGAHPLTKCPCLVKLGCRVAPKVRHARAGWRLRVSSSRLVDMLLAMSDQKTRALGEVPLFARCSNKALEFNASRADEVDVPASRKLTEPKVRRATLSMSCWRVRPTSISMAGTAAPSESGTSSARSACLIEGGDLDGRYQDHCAADGDEPLPVPRCNQGQRHLAQLGDVGHGCAASGRFSSSRGWSVLVSRHPRTLPVSRTAGILVAAAKHCELPRTKYGRALSAT